METTIIIVTAFMTIPLFQLIQHIQYKILSNRMYKYYNIDEDGNIEPLSFIFNNKEITLLVKNVNFKSDVYTCWNRNYQTLTINEIPAFTIYEIQHCFWTTRVVDYNEQYNKKQLKKILKCADKEYLNNIKTKIAEHVIKNFVEE